ncbi:rhodanese-like domain-containing protein [Lagierella sp.]|uniref:rhodanese-like domain-containing protein n=1 Tax=Lagierella sp. TaxID=2849657 RepID=UPI00262ECC6E|nr:rhodanese-like domain-containing protein [Lagierella sp.]
MKFKKVLLGLVTIAALGLTACNQPAKTDGANDTTGAAGSSEAVATTEVKKMKGDELDAIEGDNKKKDGVLVVDVRPEEQYKEGHLKHAINVFVDDLKADPEILADYKDTPVIVYCNTGKKSAEAAQILAENGYKDVTDAEGVKDYEYENIVKYSSITSKKFLEMKNDATVVDVRPAEDYDKGHVEGAVSVPFDKVEENMDKIPEGKPVITYCFTGNKSSDVANTLTEKGYEVYNVLEGTKEHDYELVK